MVDSTNDPSVEQLLGNGRHSHFLRRCSYQTDASEYPDHLSLLRRARLYFSFSSFQNTQAALLPDHLHPISEGFFVLFQRSSFLSSLTQRPSLSRPLSAADASPLRPLSRAPRRGRRPDGFAGPFRDASPSSRE